MALMTAKRNPWGARLKKLREGMTQEETAAFLKVPLTTLRNWEQGRVAPPAYVRRLIERALNDRDK